MPVLSPSPAAGLRGQLRAWLILVLLSTGPGLAEAQVPPATATAASAANRFASSPPEAALVIFNRTIAVFSAPLFGVIPTDRACRTRLNMNEALVRLGAGEVTVKQEPQGRIVMIDGEMALILTPEDVDANGAKTLDETAAAAKFQLEQVIAETRESRDESRLLRGRS